MSLCQYAALQLCRYVFTFAETITNHPNDHDDIHCRNCKFRWKLASKIVAIVTVGSIPRFSAFGSHRYVYICMRVYRDLHGYVSSPLSLASCTCILQWPWVCLFPLSFFLSSLSLASCCRHLLCSRVDRLRPQLVVPHRPRPLPRPRPRRLTPPPPRTATATLRRPGGARGH